METRTRTDSRLVWWLTGLTPLIFVLTHYLAVLPHEFSHSVTAWTLGIKNEPGNIDWGGSSLWNITLLAHIDENVDYSAALAAGKNTQVAVVAFAGLGIGNLLPYLLVRFGLVKRTWLARRPVVLYVLFWYFFSSLANLYDYVPMRNFAPDGDVTHFVLASGMSRWWIFVVGTWGVIWAITDLYRDILPYTLGTCRFEPERIARALVLVLTVGLMFAYFALPALLETEPVTLFMGRFSLVLIPVILVATWRRNVLSPLPSSALLPTANDRLSPVEARPRS
ncbi:hypothetical protein [Streptomyces sp. NPDC058874]|uniref:hypothetical protein n=1 Tax=unclassified Streptomyces TaxID=2593676 RepID=UPI0036CAE7E8